MSKPLFQASKNLTYTHRLYAELKLSGLFWSHCPQHKEPYTFSNSSSNFINFSTTWVGTSSKSFSTLSSIRTSNGVVSLLNYFNFHLWLFSLFEI